MTELLPLEYSRENLTMAFPEKDEDYKNGFACPTCNEELYDKVDGGLLESMPAQIQVCCKKCNFEGLRSVANED